MNLLRPFGLDPSLRGYSLRRKNAHREHPSSTGKPAVRLFGNQLSLRRTVRPLVRKGSATTSYDSTGHSPWQYATTSRPWGSPDSCSSSFPNGMLMAARWSNAKCSAGRGKSGFHISIIVVLLNL